MPAGSTGPAGNTGSAGYSGTPLAKKLGIKPGHHVVVLNEPPEFRSLLEGLPDDVTFGDDLTGAPDMVVTFNTDHSTLVAQLDDIAEAVFPDRMIWFAWPKKASKVQTDITEDVIRATVLDRKLVDVKVCAISDIWSGLKVVWRTEHR